MDPAAAQWALLSRILRANADTTLGRQWGFAAIGSRAEFTQHVPMQTPSQVRAQIDAAIDSQQPLTAQPAEHVWTSQHHLGLPRVPVTRPFFKDCQRTLDVWAHWLRQAHPDVASGRILFLPSDRDMRSASASPGHASSMARYVYRNLPRSARAPLVGSESLFDLSDPTARAYAALRTAVTADVRAVAASDANALVQLATTLEKHDLSLIEDVERGTFTPRLGVDAALRHELTRGAWPNPALAGRLRQRRDERGAPLTIGDIWPKMEVLAYPPECDSDSLRHTLAPLWPHTTTVGMVSAFPEGWLALGSRDWPGAGVLAIDTCFIELLPADANQAVLPEAAEKDADYRLVLTNSAGVYRMQTTSRVRCVGFARSTPVVQFLPPERGAHDSD